jgi:hypothetical protein
MDTVWQWRAAAEEERHEAMFGCVEDCPRQYFSPMINQPNSGFSDIDQGVELWGGWHELDKSRFLFIPGYALDARIRLRTILIFVQFHVFRIHLSQM